MSSTVIMNVATCHTIPAIELIRFVEGKGYDGHRISRIAMKLMGPGSIQLDSSDDWDLGGDKFDELLSTFLEGRLLNGCNGFCQ